MEEDNELTGNGFLPSALIPTASSIGSETSGQRGRLVSTPELPFLITHWLANYDGGSEAVVQGEGKTDEDSDRDEAVRRIRRAASELASAFSLLGAYGTSLRSPLEPALRQSQPSTFAGSSSWQLQHHGLRNATFSDVNRRWSNLSPSHLDSIMQSSTSSTNAARQEALRRARPLSLLDAAYEGSATGGGLGPAAAGSSGRGGGRMVGERASKDAGDNSALLQISVLQSHSLLAPSENTGSSTAERTLALSANAAAMEVDREIEEAVTGFEPSKPPPQRPLTVALGSDHNRIGVLSAQASRRYLSLREKCREGERVMRGVQRSLAAQEKMRKELNMRRASRMAAIAAAPSTATTSAAPELPADLSTSVKGEAAATMPTPINSSAPVSQQELTRSWMPTANVTSSVVALTAPSIELDAIRSKELDIERVVPQLQRKLSELLSSHTKAQADLELASSVARCFYRESVAARGFRDPFRCDGGSSLPVPIAGCGMRGNSLLAKITSRQYGGGGSWCQSLPTRRPHGMTPSPTSTSRDRKAILEKRVSHAVTMNCHLFYPVYCIKFDKTGRYFLTGADDHLVKLFHLGSSVSSLGRNTEGGRLRCNYGANGRGAVLVCTLRGHAGVITDIAVSSDNAMLATASEDGDCRVWGLKDGCPIAILRGHSGGANMVSWSELTPFRLVTSGQDGLARVWDVREAALKRYSGVIGKRTDYHLPKVNFDSSDEDSDVEANDDGENGLAGRCTEEEAILPPLPLRQEQVSRGDDVTAGNGTANEGNGEHGNEVIAAGAAGDDGPQERDNGVGDGVFVPPLPAGAEGLGLAGAAAIDNAVGHGNDNAAPGAFVANSSIDEGVQLLAKLQHGEVIEGNESVGPGTRSRRKAVKVICVTRCPIGGHFATGSDDGLGRVWADEDDCRVELLDRTAREYNSCASDDLALPISSLHPSSPDVKRRGKRRSGRLSTSPSNAAVVPSKVTLLATLAGHLNSITDMQYSSAGDRILTASQKDGVVRIWSWGKESAEARAAANIGSDKKSGNGGGAAKFTNLTQILIRLTVPASCQNSGSSSSTTRSSSSRRRGGSRTASSSNDPGVSCDVAVWTTDDSKIVTSQCCSLKATGAEIVAGSQILYVWDSRTGRCLLGISSAHNAPCPVLAPHPSDPSIMASAGADGHLNVWDLDTGRCFLEHENIVEHGPVDPPTDRGKNSGYLDGAFSPNGSHIILTDDSGRITIVDTLDSAEGARNSRAAGGNNTGTELNPVSLLGHETDVSLNAEALAESPPPAPEWMREQYFANDYYELFYDGNGYCIERGSEQPPHLAPRGARCTHAGTPYPDSINEAFRAMVGPLPLPERECRWYRDSVRAHSVEVRREGGLLIRNVQGKRSVMYAQSGVDGFESLTPTIVNRAGTVCRLDQGRASAVAADTIANSSVARPQSDRNTGNRNISSTGRALSSNYRWRDYDDVLREEEGYDEDADIDDEEYEETPRRSARSLDDGGSVSSEGMEEEEDEDDEDGTDDDAEPDRDRNTGRSLRSSSGPSSGQGRRSSSGQRLGGRPDRRRSGGRARASSAARSRRRARRDREREQVARFEERVRNQPTRVSARQITSRAASPTYGGDGSSDEDILEEISTNNTPSGPYLDDYNVLGHFFKMPDGVLHRKWLSRKESASGYCGEKTYAPQVGDSVVYIPRAHYDTVRQFPTGDNSSAPWKLWPTSSAWPVVRCNVKEIRYRFPYENYYRSRGSAARCISVVAILTLEVTGIPEIQIDRQFPWPKPSFISRQTRSSSVTFEVSVFESDHVDFIIPEHLYVWRLESLESAIREHDDDAVGLELVSYYVPQAGDEGENVEDANLIPYPCKIVEFYREPEEESEFHFHRSGLDCVEVEWTTGEPSTLSAWEVTLADNLVNLPPPPRMDEAEKAAVVDAFETIEQDPAVQRWFNHPVDVRRYSDYPNRVEIPMHVSLMRAKLESDYYSNKLSVAADMKLIRDNCVKYNDPKSDISKTANEVYEKFQEMIDDIEVAPIGRRHHQVASRSGLDSLRVSVSHTQSGQAEGGPGTPTNRRPSTQRGQVSPGTPTRSSARLSQRISQRGNSERVEEPPAISRPSRLSSLERLPPPLMSSVSRRESDSDESQGAAGANSTRRQTRSGAAAARTPSSSTVSQARKTRAATARSSVRAESDAEAESSSPDEEETDGENKEAASDESDVDYQSPNEQEDGSVDTSGTETERAPARAAGVCTRSRDSRHSSKTASGRMTGMSTRASPSKHKDEESFESDYDEEDEEEEETPPKPARTSARQRGGGASSSTANSHRKSTRTTRSNSRDADDSDEMDSSDDEEETKPPAVGRRASRASVRYEEPDEDEFTDEYGSESSEDFIQTSRSAGGRSTKRSKATKRRGSTKKARIDTEQPRAGYQYFPDIRRWPKIDTKDIPRMINAIMMKMDEEDTSEMFRMPVVETYPEVADSYLGRVHKPMDFRTIREERAHTYRAISDLQDDLILVFKNCCVFNGEGNDYFNYALKLWNKLNDVFTKTCAKEGVRLPRRW